MATRIKLFFLLILLVVNCFAANQPQKLTVILDWFVNPDHAPLFVAQQQGYFQAQNLDVTFIAPADPADPPKLVAAGKADIALDYQPHLLMEKAQGLPLTQVGTLIPTPLGCMAVLQNSSIYTLKDLKGKKIGYSVDSIDRAMLQGMLQSVGLNLSDVELINVRYSLTQALMAHQIDAAVGLMRNFEPIQMQLMGQPARLFYPEQNGIPSYSELIFIANSKQQNNPEIAKFLVAVGQGAAYLKAHPEATWQQFAKNHPELNNELNHRAWLATAAQFADNPAQQNVTQCRKLADYLHGALDPKINENLCD